MCTARVLYKHTLALLAIFCICQACQNGKNAGTNSPTMDTNIPPHIMPVDITGHGPKLVILGGGLTGSSSFKSHQEVLSAHRQVALFQLLAVQWGLEGKPLPEEYSFLTEVDAVGATLDSLGWQEPVDLFGFSSGGEIALQYAITRPERIRKLVLLEPSSIWILEATGRMDAESERALARFRAIEEELTSGDEITEEQLIAFLEDALAVGTSPKSYPQWDTWFRYRNSLRAPSSWNFMGDIDLIRSFDKPVLLIKGAGSPKWLHNITDGLAENLLRPTVVDMQGGHIPHLIYPDEFNARLEQFLGD
jgi:pimeloyl-ACP methyl ester carboxylesterase